MADRIIDLLSEKEVMIREVDRHPVITHTHTMKIPPCTRRATRDYSSNPQLTSSWRFRHTKSTTHVEQR